MCGKSIFTSKSYFFCNTLSTLYFCKESEKANHGASSAVTYTASKPKKKFKSCLMGARSQENEASSSVVARSQMMSKK